MARTPKTDRERLERRWRVLWALFIINMSTAIVLLSIALFVDDARAAHERPRCQGWLKVSAFEPAKVGAGVRLAARAEGRMPMADGKVTFTARERSGARRILYRESAPWRGGRVRVNWTQIAPLTLAGSWYRVSARFDFYGCKIVAYDWGRF